MRPARRFWLLLGVLVLSLPAAPALAHGGPAHDEGDRLLELAGLIGVPVFVMAVVGWTLWRGRGKPPE